MRWLRHIVILFAALLAAHGARAQYYDWGVDPASIRWNHIRTPAIHLIYPGYFEQKARETLSYLDAARPSIAYGFRRGPMKTPVILHTENFRSNGLVIWAPKRIEMLAIPDLETYSMPWLKQLAAHEYRHNVQYNNLNRHTVRALYYLLGDQGAFVSLLLLPLWLLEGDAVMMETEMSTYGRGLQPSFTMGYRAAGNIASSRRIDKWFCGSYREYIPDHYRLGYQIASYAYTRYNEFIWDKVAAYGAKYPFTIATTSIALRKYYDTSVTKLFRETFEDLEYFWGTLPEQPNSARILPTPEHSYTTYRHPLFASDGHVIALKKDFGTHDHFVRVDPATGEETPLAYIGSLSTRPALHGKRLWWTEYRRSTLWGERYNSQLCYMDLDECKPRTVRGQRETLYPTPLPEGRMAWVEYAYEGIYSIVSRDRAGNEERLPMPSDIQLLGLAWDDATRRLYFIALDDRGMWLGGVDARGMVDEVTAPAYITLSNLRALDGKLYFGSIQSGKDEAHMLDLATGVQYRLSSSTYGSFSPAPSPAGEQVAMTTYDRNGYHLSLQQTSEPTEQVEPSHIPRNTVNPPRRHWEVVNLDTVRLSQITVKQTMQPPSRRYRKGAHLFKPHSWAPVEFKPFDLTSETDFDMNLGATIVSQNLLSSMTSYLSYGWERARGSMIKGGLRYFGLGPVFEFEGQYGGGKQVIYSAPPPGMDAEPGKLQSFATFTSRISLPLQIKGGYHARYLTPEVEWERNNGLLYNVQKGRFTKGIDKLTASLLLVDNVAMAYRDLLPQWGYAAKVSYTINPTNNDFSPLWTLYGRLYVPGLLKHHSLTLRGAYQSFVDPDNRPHGFQAKELFPRGARFDFRYQRYIAAAADYQFPLLYPDWGISSILFIKRVRLNLGYNYARYYGFPNTGVHRLGWHDIHSVGGDVIFDVNLFRQPDSATTSFKVSIYKPSSRGSVRFSVGVALPI